MRKLEAEAVEAVIFLRKRKREKYAAFASTSFKKHTVNNLLDNILSNLSDIILQC